MHDSHFLPVGPQHPALKEAIFLKMQVKNNLVENIELNLGYMHKGIERLIQGHDVNQALIQVERICGICSQAHSQCFSNAIENLAGVEVPLKARLERMMMQELERMHSHLVLAGTLFHEIGLQTLFMLFWRERERILDCFDVLTGGRVHHAVSAIGGAKHDFSPEEVKLVKENIAKVERFVKNHLSLLKNHDVIKSRFKGIGVISKKKAAEFDLVGPAARASGLKVDTRKQQPYELYEQFRFDLVLEGKGDVMARLLVRLQEVLESAKIIYQAIEQLPLQEKVKFSVWVKPFQDSAGFALVEAPRGELFHFVSVKGNKIERFKAKTPTFQYMNIFPEILTGLDITDIPVVLESMDPCFSCMERSVVAKGTREMLLGEFLKKEKVK